MDVVIAARRCGLAFVYVPAVRNGFATADETREDKGNAILSTLPLSDVTALELPFEAARRVVVVATVVWPAGQDLRLASVHFLSMTRPWRILTTGNGSRLREALALLDGLDELSNAVGSATTLVGGDFNTWSSRETALLRLREHFHESPNPLSEPTRGAFPTDHVFFLAETRNGRPNMSIEPGSYRRIEQTYNSDHHPIELRVGSVKSR